MTKKRGHQLGLHRVIEPDGALPQAADRLDAKGPVANNEIAIDVDTLNIDSASFEQIVGDVGRDSEAIGRRIEEIVAGRGKMQNPVTGSGGMLIGRIAAVGDDYDGPVALSVGDRVATLVSLTLTPLAIDAVNDVYLDSDQVDVEATAYLWPTAPVVVMPDDIDDRVALAALDVCGAPAQTQRLVDDGDRLLILGAGKSGMLCAAAARALEDSDVEIFGVDVDGDSLEALGDAGLFDHWDVANARRPAQVLEVVESMTGGRPVDVVINTCNVEATEMAAILPVRQNGTVYFFNMATDFSRAALGAEGVGCDARLLIGNGYARNHARIALEIVRNNEFVRRRLQAIVGADNR